MKKQINPTIRAHLIRGAFYLLLLFALCVIPFAFGRRATSTQSGTLLAFFRAEAATNVSQRTLTFAERVSYQRAIEDVYWRHRIWPKERPDPKPSLDAVMSQAQLEKKVQDYLRKSQALEDYWQRPLTAEQLQAEMDRVAQHTKQPEVLRELFEVLGNDPFVIAECLARPTLAERSLLNCHPYDQIIQGEFTQSADADLRAHPMLVAWENEPVDSSPAEADNGLPIAMAAQNGAYTLPGIPDTDGCVNNTWTATSITNAPAGRFGHTAVWTGTEMIVWGGGSDNTNLNAGGRYNPSTDSWTATSTANAPYARSGHTAVWTGNEMIIWGGRGDNTGGRYNPATNSWTPTSTINAPTGRSGHTAVWTGSEMIVWGGVDPFGFALNTGGKYNPSTSSWAATTTTNAPTARISHTAIWSGSEMIVWGGWDGLSTYLSTGGRYNAGSDSWTATSTSNVPTGRENHKAVWTSSEMIVWGGDADNGAPPFNTGGRYNPGTNAWTATSTTNAPSARSRHTAVWTLSEMIVWGGSSTSGLTNTGGRYNPGTGSWTAISTANAPAPRVDATAVWTGNQMIVWGGWETYPSGLNTGGRYCAPAPPVVTTNPATYVASNSATLNGSVSPAGLATTVHFQYGTTTSYGHATTSQSYNGYATQSVSANISGLSASTTYHFRIVATNSIGTTYGSDRTFTTLTATGPPVVITSRATLIASFSATLNGSVDPHGLTTTVYFQYGTTTSYGLTTAPQSQAGSIYRNISANINGLLASTVYHFRIVATNSAGTIYGADRAFTTLGATGPPVVTTNPASYIASFTANLNGTVDPHGLTTTVHFQYGTTTSYGLTSMTQTQSGNTYRNVAAGISGLLASTTYHFRIVATNSAGTSYGADQVFTTLSATGPPVVTTRPATNVTSSSATLNGVVDPHGLTTSAYFQYGTTTSYGHNTPAQSETGNTYQSVTANISGLSASTTYHFRIVATNSDGTRYGADMAFTTP
jgi:N-acetylneuraminic acid mutarotase